MKKLLLFILAPFYVAAQPGPEVTSWIINTTGQTGYSNILSNVQLVQYSANNVYVTATCIPSYSIGPWTANPNTPVDQNFLFKITRAPLQNIGNQVVTPMGHIGVWTNGVSVFNAKDGMSYNNQGVWFRDALYWEGISFDNCLGHPAPNGEYHLHVNPTCLYDDTDSTVHSPIIGYAFDGFPIYGAYGFSNVNGTGPTRTMLTSYRKRSITTRTSLPDGTVLNANQYGPAVSTQYPLGAFLEDYEFVQGLGDLDEHNGRFCVTPEYPNGIYAYFVTLDFNQEPLYPYVLGPYYYGTVQAGNTGPGSGHNTIGEPVVVYVPGTSGVMEPQQGNFVCVPNPSSGRFEVRAEHPITSVMLYDGMGRQVFFSAPTHETTVVPCEVEGLTAGIYLLSTETAGKIVSTRIMIRP
jgi:hypothetical protein